MKINKNIRVQAIKRIIKRLENKVSKLTPYGYQDTMVLLYTLEYWKDLLDSYEK